MSGNEPIRFVAKLSVDTASKKGKKYVYYIIRIPSEISPLLDKNKKYIVTLTPLEDKDAKQ